jgi:hypothetical protein
MAVGEIHPGLFMIDFMNLPDQLKIEKRGDFEFLYQK